MKRIPRVAAIHDLAGFGRCSLTVILPVLAAMGVQGCPIPTAYLSTHTGGFADPVRRDLTEEMEGTVEHWASLGADFEGVYTGYLSSPGQARVCAGAVERLKAAGGISVVDPVLGDGGRLYSGVGAELCGEMAELCRRADVITPNLTEAAFLLGVEYGSLRADGESGLALARALSDGGRRSVVLTGITDGAGRMGAACFDRESGEGGLALAARVEGSFHGTGDLFAAVLTGALVCGEGLLPAARRAAEFVSACAAHTADVEAPRREGVEFEPLLHLLRREKDL